MNAATRQHEWAKFLKFFSEQNAGRLTRLGIFEPNTYVVNDLWLECGLPLVCVDLDMHDDSLAVQIMVGSLTHEIKNVVKLSSHFTASDDEDGLDVLGGDGRLTVLRFEKNEPSPSV